MQMQCARRLPSHAMGCQSDSMLPAAVGFTEAAFFTMER